MFFFWRSKEQKPKPLDTTYDPATQSLVVDDHVREGDLLEVTVRKMTYCEVAIPALKAIKDTQPKPAATAQAAATTVPTAVSSKVVHESEQRAAGQVQVKRVVADHSPADDYVLYGERGAEAVDQLALNPSRRKTRRRNSSRKTRRPAAVI